MCTCTVDFSDWRPTADHSKFVLCLTATSCRLSTKHRGRERVWTPARNVSIFLPVDHVAAVPEILTGGAIYLQVLAVISVNVFFLW